MTQPGQWHLDRTAGRLVYWPLPGEDMAKAEAIAPSPDAVVHGVAAPKRSQPLRLSSRIDLVLGDDVHYNGLNLDTRVTGGLRLESPAGAIGCVRNAAERSPSPYLSVATSCASSRWSLKTPVRRSNSRRQWRTCSG